MIELAFDKSAAGARLNGATAMYGSTRKEQCEAMKPRNWSGITMAGSSKDVEALTLALDIGDISDMDSDMNARQNYLTTYLQTFPAPLTKYGKRISIP